MVSFRAFLSAQTYAYGLITVLLYGAPIYAFLAQRGHANWLAAAVLGVAPGVGALLIDIYPMRTGGGCERNRRSNRHGVRTLCRARHSCVGARGRDRH